MTLALKGIAAEGVELTVGITMRRLGQYKTAWPAVKTTLLQAGVTDSEPSSEAEKVRKFPPTTVGKNSEWGRSRGGGGYLMRVATFVC